MYNINNPLHHKIRHVFRLKKGPPQGWGEKKEENLLKGGGGGGGVRDLILHYLVG
jgi:hypothetical protein